MANRYWVGGTDSWDGTAGSKWSLTSGGSGGQAVPTSSDTVFFDASSGSGTVTIASGAICSTLTMTGFTGTLAFGSNNIEVAGTGTVYTGATTFSVTGTPLILSTNETGTRTFNTGAVTEANAISFDIGQQLDGGSTVTFTSSRVKNINFNAGTFPFDEFWRPGAGLIIYGDLTMNTSMFVSSTGAGATPTITFAKTGGTQNITSSLTYGNFNLAFSGTATYKLQNNFTVNTPRIVTLSSGTLDLNGFTLYTNGFTTDTGTKNITFNGGTLVCTGATTTAFNNAAPTGFTTTAGTGTGKISMTAATAKTFVGGGSTFNCTLNQGGAGALTITGSNTFNDITKTWLPASVLFTAGTTSTFNNFNLLGIAGNLVTIGSTTAGSTFTLSKSSGIVSGDYLSISDSVATGGATWYAGANSTNGGNNTGWTFTTAPIRYWVGGTGTWDPASTSWSVISGGSSGYAAPLATDDAIFDANSGGGTVDVQDGPGGSGFTPECKNLICTGFTGSIDSTVQVLNVNGDVTLSSGGDFTLLYVSIVNGSSGTLTSVGKTIYEIGVDGGSTLTLADDLVDVSSQLFVGGTCTTNNFNVTAPIVYTTGTLNMGSSTFTVGYLWYVDTAATVNAGTSTISMTDINGQFEGGDKVYYNLDIGNTISIYGSNTFNTISNSTQPITINFAAGPFSGSLQIVTNFNVSGTAGNLVTLQSTTSGTQFNLSKSSGTVSRDYLSIKDSNAIGFSGTIWYAGANSTNVSNNSGWTFTAPPAPGSYDPTRMLAFFFP